MQNNQNERYSPQDNRYAAQDGRYNQDARYTQRQQPTNDVDDYRPNRQERRQRTQEPVRADPYQNNHVQQAVEYRDDGHSAYSGRSGQYTQSNGSGEYGRYRAQTPNHHRNPQSNPPMQNYPEYQNSPVQPTGRYNAAPVNPNAYAQPNTQHYAPEAISVVGSQYSATRPPEQPPMRRKKTTRQIPLTPQGNLVIDVPVANRIARQGRYNDGIEFTHMRYTAVTCHPDEFSIKGYSLRQQELNRQTELFIVVTMYNEDDFLFCKSMQALMKNIAYLCSRTRSPVWGEEGWKKAVICIVSDGRSKVNSRVLDVLGIMGVYQNGIMKDHVNGAPVTGHIFEYTTQVCVTPELKVQGHEKGYVPVQILFCLKEKNAKKINSHRWFFKSFGPLIRPNVCILIDVGTKPTNTSLYHLWKAFDKNPSVGGACGEIYAELGTGCVNLLNPLVAAQNFEYKMSNILDKPLESVCGYISVLPGAFSAYRYTALLGKPLEQYFLGETLHGSEDIFAANMYLAEDRILCFEIVTKVKEAWLLKYVKSAQAETDVPDSTPEFISQRRRWLNGSFFASIHALSHWFYIFRSGHSFVRKLILCFEFTYNLINVFFSWFGLSFFYLTFYFLVGAIAQSNESDPFTFNKVKYGAYVFPVLNNFYFLSVIIVFICSLGNRPQGSKVLYNVCIGLFMIIMLLMLYISGYSIFKVFESKPIKSFSDTWGVIQSNKTVRDVCLSTLSNIGLYIVASCLYLDPWHMLTSFIQYMLFLPSFTNILNVYSFCNLHDVSWGTKGDNAAASLGGVTAVKGKDGKETVEVEMITEKSDIDKNYEKFISSLSQPRPLEKSSRDAQTKMEDYFKSFRTRVVLSWVFSNGLVVIAMTSQQVRDAIQKPFLLSGTTAETAGNPFLSFIFYSVLALSTVRFIGSTLYLILRMLGN